MTVHAREERTTQGILLMALAVVFFTAIDTSAKWLVGVGLAVFQVVFARFAGHFLLACLVYLPRDGWAAFRSARPRLQLLRSVFLSASTAFNFAALQHLPLTVTTTIFFAGPVLVTLLAIPILNETVGLRRLIAVCTGFVGVLIVMQPWGIGWDPAMLFSLSALGCASMYFIMTRKLAGIESDSVSQLWSSGLGAAVYLPLAVAGWTWPETAAGWSVFLGIGAFGLLGHSCAVVAHRWADASVLSPVVYIQLILAAVVGIVLFGQWPTAATLGGGSIIIGSGLYIWMRERRVTS